jgi:hypothetical protein
LVHSKNEALKGLSDKIIEVYGYECVIPIMAQEFNL